MFFYFVRQSFEEAVFLQLTLPDHNQIPAEFLQLFFSFSVSLDIPIEFLPPEFDICGRCRCLTASGMPMPEASSDFNHSFVFWQNDIRMSGK